MIKKLFNGEAKSITSAAIIIGAASLASRLLGVVRDRILASEFGAGQTLDIYYSAFRLPDLIYNLLVLGALSAGFIPVFVQYLKSDEDEWQLASGILNVMFVGIAILLAVLYVLAPWLTPLISPGFTPAAQGTTVVLTRIMLLSPLFLGLSAVFGGILQSLKKFFVYSLAPIFYNVGIMIGALFFSKFWGVAGLAWGVVLGAALHMLVQLPVVFSSGFKYSTYFSLAHKGVRRILKLMVPRTLGLAVTQVNLLVVNIIASSLTMGSIAVFNLANNLQSFPTGIFSLSFAIAAFPALSAYLAGGERQKFVSAFSQTSRQILFFIVPLSALFLVLRAQIVRVILGAGQFDWNDTILTADTLALFCLSLFAQGLIPLLTRGFYALQNTLTPFLIGLVSAGINVVLALYLVRANFGLFTLEISGVAGLALAFSLSSIINFILLWVFLKIKIGNLDEARVLLSVFKISLATLALGLVTQSLKYLIEPYTGTETFLGIFTQGVVAGLGGIMAFILVCWLLKSEELLMVARSLRRRFLKAEAMEEVGEEI